MTTETTVDIGSLIHFPKNRDGRPCLAGTGMSVYRVVSLHKTGMTPAEMHEAIPDIPVSHFYAALAYYFANQAAVDSHLEADEAEAGRLYEGWVATRAHPA